MMLREGFVSRTAVLGLFAAALLLAGCGRGDERFYAYPLGKINLDRVTYVTPRIKVGLDEFPLQPDGIAEVIGKLRAGEYSFFRVQAVILFDEFAWTVYKSESFDKDKNPLDAVDIKLIEKNLQRAYRVYRGIE